MDQLAQHIESLIFTATSPISFKDLKGCLEESFDTKLKKPAMEKAIEQLKERYQQEDFSFELVEIAGGFQFLTKASFHHTIGVYLKQTTKKRLSKAALETLSIIAYKQPVVKSEMEKIRGVSCDYSVQKLLEKELIAIVGRNDSPGQPLLYGTSEKFMDYFGLKSIEDLPQPKDFREPDQEIGEKAPIDEKISLPEEQMAITVENAPPTASSPEIVEDQPTAMPAEQEDLAEPLLKDIPPSASSDETMLEDTVVTPVEDTTSSDTEAVIAPIVKEEDQEIENPIVLPTTTTEVAEVLSTEEEAIIVEEVQTPTTDAEKESTELPEEEVSDDIL